MDAAGRMRAAMATHPRERFLPASEVRRAAYDGPLDIGHGQTNSQPRTVQAMLELLDVQPGQRVLDVGSGSGWTTALLAALVGPTGSVLGVERVPDLVVTGAANVEACRMPWARVRAAVTGVLGAPDEAPFYRVLVSAMATRLPEDWSPSWARPASSWCRWPVGCCGSSATPAPRTGGGSPSTATTASSRWSPADRRGPETDGAGHLASYRVGLAMITASPAR